jgi:ribosomal protein L29
MKKQEITKLREKSIPELQKQVRDLKVALVQITPRMSVGEVKNLKEKRKMRVEIAQILGIIRELEDKKHI